jgi:putative tryptophan/tyrosine transport system substrate-binding protein
MTTRRAALMALPALSAAPFAGAQTPRPGQPKRIGDLSMHVGPEGSDPSKPLEGEGRIWDDMRKKGWILGENCLNYRVFANSKPERLPRLVEELVRARVDVILTDGEDAAVAAARATRTIPILATGLTWPVEIGLIEGFAKPGRNVTGFADHAGAGTVNKRMQFLRAMVPGAKRLSWLWGGSAVAIETVAGGQFDPAPLLESEARALGFDLRIHVVRAPDDMSDVFAEVISWAAHAVTAGGWQVWSAREELARLGLRHRVPVAAFNRSYVSAGALLSYGPTSWGGVAVDTYVLEYLDRILRGARPAELPVIQPSRYELVINTKTAKSLGLTISQALQLQAQELLQ